MASPRGGLLRDGLGAVALAAVLPFLSVFQLRFVSPEFAASQAPMMFLLIGALVLLGLRVAAEDPPLGLAVVLVALNVLRLPVELPLLTAVWFTAGAAGLVAARGLPWSAAVAGLRVRPRALAQSVLVAAGALEAILLVLTWLGYSGWPWRLHRDAGTFGHANHVGWYLAVLTPLAPLWLLPLYFAGLTLAHSLLAVVAAFVGLTVRFAGLGGRPWRSWAGLLVASSWLSALGLVVRFAWDKDPGTSQTRLAAWALGAGDWLRSPLTILAGSGTAAWPIRVPHLQQVHSLTWGLFLQAHNELLQALYEHGWLALLLLVWWLGRHRAAWRATPLAGAAAALGVTTLAGFPLHLAPTALTGAVVLGLATAPAGPDLDPALEPGARPPAGDSPRPATEGAD